MEPVFRAGLVVLLTLLLCGCANPYAKFYRDYTNGADISSNPNIEVKSGYPRLIPTSSHDEDAQKLREDGYTTIGSSSFIAGNIDDSRAIDHGENVKSSIVLLTKKYINSESGTIPLTLPNTQTSYSSFSGNVYGNNGSANYSGSGTTTTYDTQTTYIPYTVHRYNYMASYWVKVIHKFGVDVIELSANEKATLGSNKGVVVIAVIKNTPAYYADILKGDIFRKMGNDSITDLFSYKSLVGKYEGHVVKITLVRNGQEIVKEVNINTE